MVSYEEIKSDVLNEEPIKRVLRLSHNKKAIEKVIMDGLFSMKEKTERMFPEYNWEKKMVISKAITALQDNLREGGIEKYITSLNQTDVETEGLNGYMAVKILTKEIQHI